MKVFLSWSGEPSRQVALVLHDWLPQVIQAIEPWISAKDVDKGSWWSTELRRNVDDAKAGIVCVTPDNVEASWLAFEAGALAKTVADRSLVCPYLVGLHGPDLTGPLSHFQATVATEDDTRQLVDTLNRALGEGRRTDKQLTQSFGMWWPRLNEALQNISLTVQPRPRRSTEDMLEELLTLARDTNRRLPDDWELAKLSSWDRDYSGAATDLDTYAQRLRRIIPGSERADLAKLTAKGSWPLDDDAPEKPSGS